MPNTDSQRRRTDTEDRTYFRCDRFYRQDGGWYFCTREGDQGPFVSKAQADAALHTYLIERAQLARFQEQREREAKLEQVRAHAAKLAGKEARDRMLRARNSHTLNPADAANDSLGFRLELIDSIDFKDL